jgi:type II secretory pathway pseudopilin PulG
MSVVRRIRSARGITLVEITIIASISALMAGMAGPALGHYLTEARYTKARHDTHVIAMSFSLFAGSVLTESTKERGWATVELLVGAGGVPSVGGGGDRRWAATSGPAAVASLDDHLVTNAAGYRSSPRRQVNAGVGWDGPYVEAGIGADPWGHRYAINVGAQGTRFVLSAGPNGLVETAFESAAIVPGGDDIIALVAAGN